MFDYDRNRLGEYLKEARTRAKLTQAEVSRGIGYSSAQFVSNIERGASVAPIAALSKMAKLYNIGIGKIVEIIIDGQRQVLTKKLNQVSRRQP